MYLHMSRNVYMCGVMGQVLDCSLEVSEFDF